MDGSYNNQPPYITPNQAGVQFDPITTNSAPAALVPYNPFADNGGYIFQSGISIWSNVAHGSDMSSAVPTLPQSATVPSSMPTCPSTRPAREPFSSRRPTGPRHSSTTVRTEQDFGTSSNHNYKSDEVTVTVQQGAVTIVAAGDEKPIYPRRRGTVLRYQHRVPDGLPVHHRSQPEHRRCSSSYPPRPRTRLPMAAQPHSSRFPSLATTPGHGSGRPTTSLSMQGPTRSTQSASPRALTTWSMSHTARYPSS